jgi:hypothetical protein
VYQGGYDPTPTFMKPQTSNSAGDTQPVANHYPTLASLRQDHIAAYMPSSYPSTPQTQPSYVAASPPPIYQNALHDTLVPEYSDRPSNS